MKKFMKISMFLLILLMMSIIPTQAAEEDDTEEINVSLIYQMDGTQFYKMDVKVSGPGSLKDGDAIIREGINTYEMREESEKTFEIQADTESHVSSIMIDGVEIKDKIKDRFTIHSIKADTELVVSFEKDKKEPEPETPSKPGEIENPGNKGNHSTNNGNGPNTGDIIRSGGYVGLGTITLIMMSYIKRKGKNSEVAEEEK